MIDIDWSKAPEGATHFEPANGHIIASWMKLDGDTWFFWTPKSDNPEWKRAFMFTDGRVDRMIPRPIRTPEQIAAEEREKAVAEMLDGIDICKPYSFAELAGIIHDKGYRKVEGGAQ